MSRLPSGLGPTRAAPNPREPFTRARSHSTPLFHTRRGGNSTDLDDSGEVRRHLSLSPLPLPHARLSLCLFGGKVGGTVDDEGAAGWGGGRGEWG